MVNSVKPVLYLNQCGADSDMLEDSLCDVYLSGWAEVLLLFQDNFREPQGTLGTLSCGASFDLGEEGEGDTPTSHKD